MADPRLSTSRTGLFADLATFAHDGSIVYSNAQVGGSVSVGKAVKLVSNGTVALTTAGSNVIGELVSVGSDGFCTVRVGGVCTLPKGDGSATLGLSIVGDVAGAAEGYIRSVTVATAAELGVSRGVILDASVTTAVEVLL